MHFHLKQKLNDSCTRKKRTGEKDPTWDGSEKTVAVTCGSAPCLYLPKQ